MEEINPTHTAAKSRGMQGPAKSRGMIKNRSNNGIFPPRVGLAFVDLLAKNPKDRTVK